MCCLLSQSSNTQKSKQTIVSSKIKGVPTTLLCVYLVSILNQEGSVLGSGNIVGNKTRVPTLMVLANYRSLQKSKNAMIISVSGLRGENGEGTKETQIWGICEGNLEEAAYKQRLYN